MTTKTLPEQILALELPKAEIAGERPLTSWECEVFARGALAMRKAAADLAAASELSIRQEAYQQGWDNASYSISRDKPQPSAKVPEGWKLTRCEDGTIIVQKDGLGGYAAWKDDSNIASSILYHFADELLAAAPAAPDGTITNEGTIQQPQDAEDAARYRYIRTISPRKFNDLWELNIAGKGQFDDLVDAERAALAKKGGAA